MSKVRVVLAEMEGSDESVQAAIRTFRALPGFDAATPSDSAAAVATPPQIPAPGVDVRGALASPPLAASSGAEGKPQRDHRRVPKGAKRNTGSTLSPASLAPAASPASGCVEACLAALGKGPRTSVELIAITKFTSGSVYPVLQKLREQGRVEMFADPADGQRKNRLRG